MTKDMTTGNPLKLILLFSLPVLFGNLFQQFYNMVDTIIVGQFLGEDALAAVGATGSIMFLVLGFASGLAQGFGVMVSQAFGAKDESRLKHIVALSFLLTIIISVILTALTVTTSRELLIFMNTPDNILDMAKYLSEIKKPVWIRHVLVPQLSDFDEDLDKLSEFIDTLDNVERVEVLPYHTLGAFKWETLGIPYSLNGVRPPDKERISNANKKLKTYMYK